MIRRCRVCAVRIPEEEYRLWRKGLLCAKHRSTKQASGDNRWSGTGNARKEADALWAEYLQDIEAWAEQDAMNKDAALSAADLRADIEDRLVRPLMNLYVRLRRRSTAAPSKPESPFVLAPAPDPLDPMPWLSEPMSNADVISRVVGGRV